MEYNKQHDQYIVFGQTQSQSWTRFPLRTSCRCRSFAHASECIRSGYLRAVPSQPGRYSQQRHNHLPLSLTPVEERRGQDTHRGLASLRFSR